MPVDAAHAQVVVSGRTDGSGDMGSMPIVVRNVVGVGNEIPAVDIVGEAGLAARIWIGPEIWNQIRMGDIGAGIEDRDDNVG